MVIKGCPKLVETILVEKRLENEFFLFDFILIIARIVVRVVKRFFVFLGWGIFGLSLSKRLNGRPNRVVEDIKRLFKFILIILLSMNFVVVFLHVFFCWMIGFVLFIEFRLLLLPLILFKNGFKHVNFPLDKVPTQLTVSLSGLFFETFDVLDQFSHPLQFLRLFFVLIQPLFGLNFVFIFLFVLRNSIWYVFRIVWLTGLGRWFVAGLRWTFVKRLRLAALWHLVLVVGRLLFWLWSG